MLPYEGIDAFNELSSNGSFRYGDTVTILLGRTGGVAGVMGTGTASVSTSSGTSSGTSSNSTAGFVISAGKKDFTNEKNQAYTSYYATIVTPDGSTREYTTNNDYSGLVCSAVRIIFKDGKAVLSRSQSGSVSGKVNASKGMIGEDYLADDVKILDTAGTEKDDIPVYKRIYPTRLNGIAIKSSDVLYSSTNSNGEVDELILRNVTGDMYTYGLTLKSERTTTTVNTDMNNPNATLTSHNTVLTVEVKDYIYTYTYTYSKNIQAIKGPSRVKEDRNRLLVDDVVALKAYQGSLSNLTHTEATIAGKEYLLSDDVVVYYQRGLNEYFQIPIDDAISGNYSMTAYYDKAQSSGGRIRIIVAKDK